MGGVWKGVVELLSLDKAARLWRSVKERGGVRGALATFTFTDELKEGTHVGTDEFGNKYYKNESYSYPRDRWVIYSPRVHLDFDAGQLPGDWHRWLQHTTDVTPTQELRDARRPHWQLRHEENLTGSTKAYVPYSTVPTKISAWDPNAPRKSPASPPS